ncbi:uncharacterized protein LOC125664248 [Ostrea edulis]|uniref:uncharacterized protein LOC125664248 n=1 Tax=Ostrea edulis TaxID=37623 RepID=UPI0024AF09A7|nr:uncharacterized protein LOC125664248 [Ostrea edulis]
MAEVTQIFIFYFSITLVEASPGVCFMERNEITCCANFQLARDGKTCIPCVGDYGIHCSHTCPSGYCGQQCRTRCHCDTCDIYNCTCRNDTLVADGNSGDVVSVLSPLIAIISPVLGVSFVIVICRLYTRDKGLKETTNAQQETEINTHVIVDDNNVNNALSHNALSDDTAYDICVHPGVYRENV